MQPVHCADLSTRDRDVPSQTKASSNNSTTNCFQLTPESYSASHDSRGEHHTQRKSLHKHALAGFTTHAYSLKYLELIRLPHSPLFRLTAYALNTCLNTHAHLTPQH